MSAHPPHDHSDDDDARGGHARSHVHAAAGFGCAFAIGIGLNVGFVVVEAVYGVLGNSMALLADAGHNLGDVLGLVIAWVAACLAKRPPSSRFTYGLRGSSILAALFNAVFLLIAVGAIAWEAILRLLQPEPVAQRHGDGRGGARHRRQRRRPPGCSPPAARATSICAAPSCTWPPMPRCRPAWCSPARPSSNRLALARSASSAS